MHELAICQLIVDVCAERAGPAKVRRVTLEVGGLAAVMIEALQFSFDLCCRGTALDGALLDVVEVTGRGRCRRCGALFEMPDYLTRCACGSCDVECVAGDDFMIRSMEVV